MLPLYQDHWFTFRFADDRIIPRFHLEGVEVGRRVSVFGIDSGTGKRLGLLATAAVGEGGWVNLNEPIRVRAGDAFVAVPEQAGWMGDSGMIFRLSHKLNAKVKAGPLAALPLHENPFADWSAGLFVAGRTQYILLSNTKSLYSTVMYGRGITDDTFIARALSNMREFLAAVGQEFVFRRFIVPETTAVRFAGALNRSVTGSMNELIAQATVWLAEGDPTPHDVGVRLNDILLSALARSKSDKYGTPRDAFKALVIGSALAQPKDGRES